MRRQCSQEVELLYPERHAPAIYDEEEMFIVNQTTASDKFSDVVIAKDAPYKPLQYDSAHRGISDLFTIVLTIIAEAASQKSSPE